MIRYKTLFMLDHTRNDKELRDSVTDAGNIRRVSDRKLARHPDVILDDINVLYYS